MQEWARRRLVPKVLVANQTQIVEAVCDARGEWLPGVPVIGVYPRGAHWDDEERGSGGLATAAWEIAAVLKVTESRVCQLHSQSIARLRVKLRAY